MSGVDEDEHTFTKEESETIRRIEHMKSVDDMYTLPKGTHVFRGDNNLYKTARASKKVDMKYFESGGNYFSVAKSAVDKYGCVYRFKTKRALRFVAIDQLTLDSDIYRSCPPEIQEILRKNYGVGTKERYRWSVHNKDNQVVKYICSNADKYGWDGYLTKRMEQQYGSDFHVEIVICKPGDVLEDATLVDADCAYKLIAKPDKKTRPINSPMTKRYGMSPTPNSTSKATPSKKLFGTPNSTSKATPTSTPKAKKLFGTPTSTPKATPSKKLFGTPTSTSKAKSPSSMTKKRGSPVSKPINRQLFL